MRRTNNESYWNRVSAQRFSRRTALRSIGAGGAGAAALALVGCGDDDDDGTPAPAASAAVSAQASAAGSPAAATPKKGGTYIDDGAFSTTATSNDPHTALNGGAQMWGYFQDRMIVQDRLSIEPARGVLVESWEQVDPSTLLLTVRKGVNFQPGITKGRAFTAEDVAFSLQRITGKFDPSRKTLFQRAGTLQGMDNATATDANHVKVTFSSPNALFVNGVADYRNFPVAKEIVDADPNFQDPGSFRGTGAFIIKSFDNSSKHTVFEANPAYWQPGLPYLAGIDSLGFQDPASATAAFVSKQTSVTTASAPAAFDTIKKGRADANIVSSESSTWGYIKFNQERGALKDARVRKALFLVPTYARALDTAFTTNNWIFSGPIPSCFPGAWTPDQIRGMPGWNPDTKTKDLADAKALLEAAGYPNGKGLTFGLLDWTAAGTDLVIALKDEFDRALPDMKLTIVRPTDSADFNRRLTGGDFDLVQYVSTPSGAALLEGNVHYHTGASRNYSKLSDPDVDALIDKGLNEFNADTRKAIVGQLQQKIMDLSWVAGFYRSKGRTAVDPKVQGWETAPGPGVAFASQDASSRLWFA